MCIGVVLRPACKLPVAQRDARLITPAIHVHAPPRLPDAQDAKYLSDLNQNAIRLGVLWAGWVT